MAEVIQRELCKHCNAYRMGQRFPQDNFHNDNPGVVAAFKAGEKNPAEWRDSTAKEGNRHKYDFRLGHNVPHQDVIGTYES